MSSSQSRRQVGTDPDATALRVCPFQFRATKDPRPCPKMVIFAEELTDFFRML